MILLTVPLFFSNTRISSLAKNAILVGKVMPSATTSTFRSESLSVGYVAMISSAETINGKIEVNVSTMKIVMPEKVIECKGTLFNASNAVNIFYTQF